MTMIRYPHCKVCGWAKGGVDSWDGKACKCKHTASAISDTVQANRLWHDPAVRRRFETETGHTHMYQSKFLTWALQQING